MDKNLKLVVGVLMLGLVFNLGFGIIPGLEVLPDNLPLIGNADEVVAGIIVDQALLGGVITKAVQKLFQ